MVSFPTMHVVLLPLLSPPLPLYSFLYSFLYYPLLYPSTPFSTPSSYTSSTPFFTPFHFSIVAGKNTGEFGVVDSRPSDMEREQSDAHLNTMKVK